MKKLILILFLIIGNVLFCQTEDDLDSFNNQISNFIKNTKILKTGDNDKSLVLGLLKDIYTDTTIKYKYVELNPRIGELMINSYTLSDTIPYEMWSNTLNYYNPKDYDFIYEYDDNVGYGGSGDKLYTESIEVFDKEGNYITGMMIHYNGDNLLSIFEFKKRW